MNIIFEKITPTSVNFVGAILLLGASAMTHAADIVDVGKIEYRSSCAVCHGSTGKGDGPLNWELTHRPTDLTVLAKNNNGVFPFDRIYQIIDGRSEVKSHGSREMPVWGRSFNLQSSAYFGNYPDNDTESAARSRILALVEYLYRLQEK